MKKNRTAPTPQRITRAISVFAAPYIKKGDEWVWSGSFAAEKGSYGISITAKHKLTGSKHGILFDYALSCANANTENQKVAVFNITDFLTEANRKTDWHARDNALRTLEELHGLTIKLKKGTWKGIYSVIDVIKTDVNTGNVVFKFSDGIDELFTDAKKRYVDISRTITIKSGNAAELAKFLQTRGRGTYRGTIKPVNEFCIMDVVKYLHLDDTKADRSLKSVLETIRRLLNQLEEQGYPKYKRVKCLPEIYKWVKVA